MRSGAGVGFCTGVHGHASPPPPPPPPACCPPGHWRSSTATRGTCAHGTRRPQSGAWTGSCAKYRCVCCEPAKARDDDVGCIQAQRRASRGVASGDAFLVDDMPTVTLFNAEGARCPRQRGQRPPTTSTAAACEVARCTAPASRAHAGLVAADAALSVARLSFAQYTLRVRLRRGAVRGAPIGCVCGAASGSAAGGGGARRGAWSSQGPKDMRRGCCCRRRVRHV